MKHGNDTHSLFKCILCSNIIHPNQRGGQLCTSQRHLSNHHICSKCGRIFNNRQDKCKHSQTCFKDNTCIVLFGKQKLAHMMKVLAVGTCRLCGLSFYSNEEFADHYLHHHIDNICSLCGIMKQDFGKHYKEKHENEDREIALNVKAYTCLKCSQVFISQVELGDHFVERHATFACENCANIKSTI